MVDRGGRFSEENGRARGCGLQIKIDGKQTRVSKIYAEV